MILETDLIENGKFLTSVADKPNLSDVFFAFDKLDGDHRTQIWLHAEDSTYLLITGPLNYRYAVYLVMPEDKYYIAFDSTQPKTNVTLAAGDDYIEIPLRWMVTKNVAKRAINDFYLTGNLPASVNWEESK